MNVHGINSLRKDKNEENLTMLDVGGGSTHTGVLQPKSGPLKTNDIINNARKQTALLNTTI